MSESFDGWMLEMQFVDGVWSDITQDIIIADSIRGEYGISYNGPTDRVANTGRMEFYLNNSDTNSAGLAGYYSPGHDNCRSGFTCGIKVRLRFIYDNITKTKFTGRIIKDGINVSAGIYGDRKTHIIIVDWMHQASTHELILPAYTTNKRIDEVVELIVDNMPVVPQNTNYMIGDDTFSSVFDSVGNNTTALNEFNKLALSEYGYIYLTGDETLVVESRTNRVDSAGDVLNVPIDKYNSGYLLKEDGGYLLQENGDKIILDAITEVSFTDNQIEAVPSYGKHLSNLIKVTFYPRKIDTSATVLYSMPSPMLIESGKPANFVANFRDPDNKAFRVAGKNIIDPIATTDYLFNSSSAGTGTNYTANISVAGTYGANAGSFAITNSGADGYLTYFQVRGIGIYLYDPVEYVAAGTLSQSLYGTHALNIDMIYQDTPVTAEAVSVYELANLQNPHNELDSWTFIANDNPTNLLAFMYAEPGSLVNLSETQSAYSGDTYIDRVMFEVLPNSIVKCTWRLRYITFISGWLLGVSERSELGLTTILAFG